MFLLNKTEHALVTVYGDGPGEPISAMINGYIPDKDLRILTPKDAQTLEQAAQNSVLVFIYIEKMDDPKVRLAAKLKENRLIVADVIAYCPGGSGINAVKILGMGFDHCVTPVETSVPDFKKFLLQKIITGSRRLSGMILEEEYRRLCDALAHTPASIIIFDADKRLVFISDHYFRAYPRTAPRLVRGLSVYDTFDLMSKEENLSPDDPTFEKLQKYWYSLEGSLEFTLADGVSYRLKAVQLPNRRGTVVMAQNISGYQHKHNLLEEQAALLKLEIERLSKTVQQKS